MKTFMPALMGLILLGACSTSTRPAPPEITAAYASECVANEFDYLRLDFETFNEDKKKGWRSVGKIKGCERSAASLLQAYRERMYEQNIDGMMWHEAQLRAAAGDSEHAIYLFSQTRKTHDLPMQLYRDATIAYLKQDKTALLTARKNLAAVSMPDGFAKGVAQFKKQYPDAPAPTWPMNLDVVDGFLNCFDKPYSQAYSRECQPHN
ncbi:MAG: hypothetical protein COA69_03980 [Robiginitomaculum sp.]|nr:MAG: hypothetical protein COA69_03980 [Robiginitomaculum sp.]